MSNEKVEEEIDKRFNSGKMVRSENIEKDYLMMLLEKFNELRKAERSKEAAEVEMVLRDEYPNAKFDTVRWRVENTEEERKELEKRGEEARKVTFWGGIAEIYGTWRI